MRRRTGGRISPLSPSCEWCFRHYPAYAREHAIRDIASTRPIPRPARPNSRRGWLWPEWPQNKDEAKGDAIVGELSRFGIRKPILVYSPSWDVERRKWILPLRPATNGNVLSMDGNGTTGGTERWRWARSRPSNPTTDIAETVPHSFASYRMPLNVEDIWVDVGFHITEQGKVSDVQVLGATAILAGRGRCSLRSPAAVVRAGAADHARQLSDRAIHIHFRA